MPITERFRLIWQYADGRGPFANRYIREQSARDAADSLPADASYEIQRTRRSRSLAVTETIAKQGLIK